MAKINYEVVTCSKCNGSGEYIYRSGIVGHCYPCSGSGKLKRYMHKQFLVRIADNSGVPFDWLNVKARTEAEAIKKAQKIAENGIYKENLDTITATENGVSYTYKPF